VYKMALSYALSRTQRYYGSMDVVVTATNTQSAISADSVNLVVTDPDRPAVVVYATFSVTAQVQIRNIYVWGLDADNNVTFRYNAVVNRVVDPGKYLFYVNSYIDTRTESASISSQ